ncbi:MAG TPA: hypothetical protein VFV02_15560 [Acidimicrobiales bacterium]|nr:hypothetical protein [Acidimicrobiales bacterium]
MPERLLAKSKNLLLPVAAALAGAVALAACGGGSSSASGSSPTTSIPPGSASLASYVQCLESHGVPSSVASTFGQRRRSGQGGAAGSGSGGSTPPASSPQGSPRPTIPSQYQAAFNACRGLRPSFGGGGINSAAFAAYRNCLQLHGVILPTPSTGGGSGGAGGPGGLFSQLQNDPAFKAAQQACAALAPTRSATTTTTPAAA